MAGSARYTAILDANVLYPATLRDLLLSLARDGLYHARWTERIEASLTGLPDAEALDLAGAIEKLQMPLVAARLREVAELI
ncbi:hypothetical protein [Accumulibacter sp.]|uniref:hypothetical protein n=1 Tax=Accumulibacter sp. TaxID=2053492 RepID=UPI0025C2A69B|nr:hypothetical protein [Accumulibacter sp.]